MSRPFFDSSKSGSLKSSSKGVFPPPWARRHPVRTDERQSVAHEFSVPQPKLAMGLPAVQASTSNGREQSAFVWWNSPSTVVDNSKVKEGELRGKRRWNFCSMESNYVDTNTFARSIVMPQLRFEVEKGFHVNSSWTIRFFSCQSCGIRSVSGAHLRRYANAPVPFLLVSVPCFVTSANVISQETFCYLRHVSVELLSVFVSACTALFKLVVHL